MSVLPPELIRKGRFDEIFFVDLPSKTARAEIIAIHVRKRSLALTPQDIVSLAGQSVSAPAGHFRGRIRGRRLVSSIGRPVS